MLTVDTEKSIDVATDILERLGVPVKDQEGNYRGIDVVLTDLACEWEKVSDNDKINIFTKILKSFPAYTVKSAVEIGKPLKSVLEKLK